MDVSKQKRQQHRPLLTPIPGRLVTCPSCGTYTVFTYVGKQIWPERIAKAAGVPSTMRLWECSHCHTTLSETELNKKRRE